MPHIQRLAIAMLATGLAAGLTGAPAHAQERAGSDRAADDERIQARPEQGRRTRIALGPQLVPAYPGADSVVVRPFVAFDRAGAGQVFQFEAADESAGFPVVGTGGFSFGPAVNFEGQRRSRDVGGQLPKVGFSVEVGGFAQTQLTDDIRIRVEARKAVTGHDGFVGTVSMDYVARDGDDWLFSIGPRVNLADGKFHRAYYGVSPVDAGPSGLTAFNPKGGVQSVGLTAGYLRQLSRRWGIYSYARYDRLVGDAADSPVTRTLGSPNQVSGGIALSYTFGGD